MSECVHSIIFYVSVCLYWHKTSLLSGYINPPPLSLQEHGSSWRTCSAAGRGKHRGEDDVCRRPHHGREPEAELHAAGWTSPRNLHVPHPVQPRALPLPTDRAPHRLGPAGLRGGGVQNQTLRTGPRGVADHYQFPTERLLAGPSQQDHARLHEVRFLPDVLCGWWAPVCRGPGAWWSQCR